ncbi:peroxidase 27-like [Amaranthus tricolor]|uniref:peroxidase 27-like n=1 Tax=Amaranthus tricolor TaxID=29722 RepID=UPI0025874033|nr:peroxidase 27-like [Amaranthus tricolor]
MATTKLFLLLFIAMPIIIHSVNTDCDLKVGFYAASCPQAEVITSKIINEVIAIAPSLSGPLLRMFFHDCFVRGCDASILVDSPIKQAEKDAAPNQSLRGFQIIEKVKTALEQACPGVVSCADILALVARDVVAQVGGPSWEVETGRRDGMISILNEALTSLPPPSSNINSLKATFQQKGLSPKDLVVLSAGHTIGISHCSSFINRLYNFTGNENTSDPTLDSEYMERLKLKCQQNTPNNNVFVEMDPGSFRTFDEHYYELVSKRRGLFQSDAALLDDPQTKAYVDNHRYGNREDFFRDFGLSMVKMGRTQVLTGNLGQIRAVCSTVNLL